MSAEIFAAPEVVAYLDKLVALTYGDNGRVAMLVETPEPQRHESREVVEAIAGRGFSGDHAEKSFYKGAYVPGREVSSIAKEVLDVLEVDPVVVGDNLITAGFDLAALEPGDQIQVGEAILQRSEREHRPCSVFRSRTSSEKFEAVKEARFRGTLFRVVQGGPIRVGDPIQVIKCSSRETL